MHRQGARKPRWNLIDVANVDDVQGLLGLLGLGLLCQVAARLVLAGRQGELLDGVLWRLVLPQLSGLHRPSCDLELPHAAHG
jgi:hypothetical protein